MSELDTLRSEIDEIDTQLTALFLRRMDVTARVGAYKQENGLPVLDEAREQEVWPGSRPQSPIRPAGPTSPPSTRPSWGSAAASSAIW